MTDEKDIQDVDFEESKEQEMNQKVQEASGDDLSLQEQRQLQLELASQRIAGTIMYKGCFGLAKLFKGTGFVTEKGSSLTASALRKVADGIECAGDKTSSFCYSKSDKLNEKGKQYQADTNAVKEAERQIEAILNDLNNLQGKAMA